MRFSIITITYNAAKYLEATLRSVADQPFSDVEHIVWDGGSTDGSVEIARSFPCVKVFCGKDRGIADAMNQGAKHAQGEILLFLHADDLLEKKALQRVDTAFKQHPEALWLYGEVEKIDAEGKLKGKIPLKRFEKGILKKYNMISHPATYVKRALFEEVGGFDPDLRYCMDYELWLRLSQQHVPLMLQTTLAFFREHQGSLSTSEPVGVSLEAHQVRCRYVKSWLGKWRSYRTYRRRLAKIH